MQEIICMCYLFSSKYKFLLLSNASDWINSVALATADRDFPTSILLESASSSESEP